MLSLPDRQAGKDYEIKISGNIKDGRKFEGVSKIMLTTGKPKKKRVGTKDDAHPTD
nr:hypothetical protein [Desulfobulbaceae bacterium]